MDEEAKKEAILRTLEQAGYEVIKSQVDRAELYAVRLYNQTHETINGQRVVLTKARKRAKYRERLNQLFGENIDVSKDAINQLRAIERKI